MLVRRSVALLSVLFGGAATSNQQQQQQQRRAERERERERESRKRGERGCVGAAA